jgi:ribonuclease-3
MENKNHYNCSKFLSLEEEISYKFKNQELLKRSLNHPSILKFEKKSSPIQKKDNSFDSFGSYEKLEFLGDKVLNLVIADVIFKLFPNENEGELSIRLNYLVSGKVISLIASEINLVKYINMSLSAKKIIINHSKSILEDCMEAIIGAIYLDGGFISAQKTVTRLWKSKISNTSNLISKDYKSKLQEILQQNGYPLPKYVLLKNEGSDHEPIFYIELYLGSEKFPKFQGIGSSLKAAQVDAAKKAFEFLEKQDL